MVDRAAGAVSREGAPDPLLGRVINDKFKILGFIARGGMGKVYRAEQVPLGRICAVKVLNTNYTGEHDPEFHKRFLLEASMTAKLRHPNTVTIFDYGQTDDDIYYMAMEYLEGYTLHRAIRQSGHLTEERAAHIARQVCRSLREAHSLGVVHRDLKPANIYLLEHDDEHDFVKVLDFGLVKNVSDASSDQLTQAGLFMGSPKYMAPEQISGGTVDGRTDIYALGVMLYEMVTGKVPFDRPTGLEILMAQVNEDPRPIRQMNPAADVSRAMEETIARAMAKSQQDRFRSMDEMIAALKRLGPTVPAEPSGSLTADRPSFGSAPHSSSVMSRAEMTPEAKASSPGAGEPSHPSASAPLDAGPSAAERAHASHRSTRVGLLVAVGVIAIAGGISLAKLRTARVPAPAAHTPAVAGIPAASPGATPPEVASANAPPVPAAAPPASGPPRSIAEVDVAALSQTTTISPKPAQTALPFVATPKAMPVTARAAAPAPGAPAKPSSDCNPSYYYDAEGNKHFKPECFGH